MGSVSAKSYFTSAEQETISRAVELAESGTSGEIAVMVVEESERYREGEVLGAVLLAVFLATMLAVMLDHITIWFHIPVMFLLFFPCRLLFARFPRLKLPLLGPNRMHHAVRERAIRAFYEKGLYLTRDETGILIFISLLEHKVWILGDRGIDRKIPHESWQTLAGELSSGVREKRACEALCSVIGKCGAVLAEHFPRRTGDVNELTNVILT